MGQYLKSLDIIDRMGLLTGERRRSLVVGRKNRGRRKKITAILTAAIMVLEGGAVTPVCVYAAQSTQENAEDMTNVSGVQDLYFVYKGNATIKEWKANNANAYTFDQLEEVQSYGLEKKIDKSGAIEINFQSKWSEIRFAIPENVNVEELAKVILNVSSDNDSDILLAVKILAEVGDNPVETAVAYNETQIDVTDIEDKTDIKYLGIMSMSDTPFTVTIDSVLFESIIEDSKEDSIIQLDIPKLHEVIEEKLGEDFIVGTAICVNEITDEHLIALVTRHFNAVTFGNELKPDAIFNYSNSKCPGTETVKLNGEDLEVPVTDFSRAEKMLNKIYDWNQKYPESPIKVRGHVLVWHSQTPEWFFHEDYDASKPYVDKEVMTKREEWYIKTVLEHFTGKDSKYKDMFYGWDVVNEAVSDSTGTYRNASENSSWWAVYESNEFIINAFRFANKYAPKELELYYNDYNEFMSGKVDGIVQLLKDVKNASGTRITAMGMQGHYATVGSPTAQDFKAAATAYAKVVGKVQLTELDFKASSSYDGTAATYEAESTKLAYRYKEIYDAIQELETSGVEVSGMTVWGVIDKNSWLQTSNSVGGGADGRRKQMPLLFDDNYKAKDAYWAFVDDKKLEPETKKFDILQSSGEFYESNEISFGNGDTQVKAIPIWNEKGLKVQFTVTDASKDVADAVIVYADKSGEVSRVGTIRTKGTELKDGYQAVVEIPMEKSDLKVGAQIKLDFMVINGKEKISYNDYTLSQDETTDYYAQAILKPYTTVQKGTVNIDGKIDSAWKNVQSIPLTIELGAKTEAYAKLLWDETNLYVYMNVTDSVLNADSENAHEKDSVEVFIDENNHKSSKYEEDDKQYRVNYLNECTFNGEKCIQDNIKSVVNKTNNGYEVEMAIKWTDIKPTSGTKIGLELQVNDADNSGKRIGTLSWYDESGSGWEKPSVFGTVILKDLNQNQEQKPQNTAKTETSKEPQSESKNQNTTKAEKTTVTDKKSVLEQKELELPYLNIKLDEKKKLHQDLLQKYLGQHLYIMTHLGNGVGFSVYTNQQLMGDLTDVTLETDIKQLPQFADGFTTVLLEPAQTAKIPYQIGIHVNIGVQHQGKYAYIFKKNMLTDEYERVSIVKVNEIGNVALITSELTDYMILTEN